jgi:hypothetical protein
MFITDEAAKMPVPSVLFGGQESSYWGYVKQHLHTPWFYCVYAQEYEDGGKFMDMIHLSHPTQLEQLSLVSGIEVVEVQVVLPSHMTNQDKWIMSPLASIWEGEVPEDDSTELVYITSDGQRFCTNQQITKEDQLADKRLFYQSPIEQTA